MKKLTVVLVLLCLVLVGTFALDASVVWNWYRNDRAVKYYRYQLDGEDEDNWTVVDNSVLEVSLDIDVSVVHVLYLQQSYDGIHWSESSYTESEIYEDSGYVEEDDFFYDEDFDDFEDYEEFSEETPATEEPVLEEESAAEIPVEQKQDNSKSYLNFALSYRNSIPNGDISKNLGFVVSFTYLFPYESEFSSGFRLENGYYATSALLKGLSKTDYFITLSIMGIMSFAPDKGDFAIGFGPEVQLQCGVTDPTFHYGINSMLGMRYKVTEKISLAVSASDHFFFYPKKINSYCLRLGLSLNV